MKIKSLWLIIAISSQVLNAEEMAPNAVAVVPDLKAGIQYYQTGSYFKAAQIFKNAGKDNALVDYYYARMLLYGYGALKNNQLAIEYFIAAADKGLMPAQQWLAKYYLQQKQAESALNLFKKVAEHNNIEAKLYCAAAYLFGYGVKKNPDIAKRYYIDAAKQGVALAQYTLGQDFLQARGARNHKLGELWLSKAAAQGLVITEFNIAALYKMDQRNAVSLWLSNNRYDNFIGTDYALKYIDNVWQNKVLLQEHHYNQSPKMQFITRDQLYKPQFNFIAPNAISINEYFDFLASHTADETQQNTQINQAVIPHYSLNAQIQALENQHSYILRERKWYSVLDNGQIYPENSNNTISDYLQILPIDWRLQLNYQQVLTYLYQRAILGDASAQFELGQLYQYGIAVTQNIQQAITYYELATLQQDVRAEYNLGVLYLSRQQNVADYEKGMNWLLDAAFKGDCYAQYVLGNIYEHGLQTLDASVIINADHNQAMSMYYLAAANHYGQAQYRLADYLVKENNNNLSVIARQNRIKLVKKLYQGAVDQGVVEAILPLAFYEAMDSDPMQQKHAFSVAKEQAKSGNAYAAILLGMLFERGISVPMDLREALYWYKQASNNPISDFILGTYYLTNDNYDKQAGKLLLQQAATANFSYAHYNLAIVQYNNKQEFLSELETARQLGNSTAGLLLADYYLLVADNTDKINQAQVIYQDFADRGDKEAQLKLGFLYEQGFTGIVDLVQASSWYRTAAEQGQPIAQYLLGLMYQFGKVYGAKQVLVNNMIYPDYVLAKKWYSLAKISYTPAAVALGFVLETVDDDYLEAMHSYQLAASRGDAIGEYNLGLIYESGKAQPVDLVKAAGLYLQAAKSGHKKAKTAWERIQQYGLNSL